MTEVFIEAVGIAAPGLPSWSEAIATLRGEHPYVNAPLSPHTPTLLPLNERRRATPAIRLAFQAAEDAMKASALPASSLATVFASSDADLAIITDKDPEGAGGQHHEHSDDERRASTCDQAGSKS